MSILKRLAIHLFAVVVSVIMIALFVAIVVNYKEIILFFNEDISEEGMRVAQLLIGLFFVSFMFQRNPKGRSRRPR